MSRILIWIVMGLVVIPFAEEGQWWSHFNVPQLDTVIESTLLHNGDLAAMQERVKSAEARADQSAVVLYPSLTASVGVNYFPKTTGGMPGVVMNPVTQNFNLGMVPEETQLYGTGQAGLSARYTIDAWGAGFQSRRSAGYSAKAITHDATSVALKMTSVVTLTYFDFLYSKSLLKIIEEQIASSTEILEMTRARYRSGEHSLLPVLQQEQALASRKAQLPSAKRGVFSAELHLKTLSGIETIPKANNLPFVQDLILISPNTIVEKRPDIQAERLRIKAHEHSHKAALLGHLPKIELTGMVGYDYTVEPKTNSDQAWAVGANLTLPLFAGFATSSGHAVTKAELRAAEQSLKQKITATHSELTLQEATIITQQETFDAWRNNRDAAQKAFNEAKKQYTNGLTTYLEVLNALNALAQAEINLLNAHMMVLTAQVQYIEMR
ncbi:MAG: TolC family protein, partial [Fibrobacterales bacterium]